MIVYLITNRINGKVYVGKTTLSLEQRWKQHLDNAKYGRDFYFYNAIRKYGSSAFELQVVAQTETSEDLAQLEMQIIQQYQSFNRDKGYNSTLGGEGEVPNAVTRLKMSEARKVWHENNQHPFLGKHHSESSIAKLKKSRSKYTVTTSRLGIPRNTPLSEETKRNMSEAAKRRGFCQDNIEKMRHANRGRKRVFSAESRLKMSEAAKSRKNKQISSTIMGAFNG